MGPWGLKIGGLQDQMTPQARVGNSFICLRGVRAIKKIGCGGPRQYFGVQFLTGPTTKHRQIG